ncbi:MAG: SCP2 sterol-binding domain-containing protein [Saprospiraceae bacterium]|nr:SCP2 sterol-binding domain-containing protein [Saprospiraceae bacterium]
MEFQTIKEELAAKVKTIDPIGKKLKFKLDGDTMLIDGTGTENMLTEDDIDADCTVTMSKETYVKLQQKKIKPLIATLTGKLKVKGDLGLARKLKQLM